MTQEREKWEEERQEKDNELFEVRRHLEEQRSKWAEEVKALLEKQATSAEEVTSRLQERHHQEVGQATVPLLVIYCIFCLTFFC